MNNMADDEFKLQHLLGNSLERAKRHVPTDQNAGMWLNQLADFSNSIETQTQNGYAAAELIDMLRKLNKTYAMVKLTSLPFQFPVDPNLFLSTTWKGGRRSMRNAGKPAINYSATHVWEI